MISMRGLCILIAICMTLSITLFFNSDEHIGAVTHKEDFIAHPRRILDSIGILLEWNDGDNVPLDPINDDVLLEWINSDDILYSDDENVDKTIRQINNAPDIDDDYLPSEIKVDKVISQINKKKNNAPEIDEILSKVDNSIIQDVSLYIYICNFHSLYSDSFTYAFGWSAFLCRIRFCDTLSL
jgi:hypothetical protein